VSCRLSPILAGSGSAPISATALAVMAQKKSVATAACLERADRRNQSDKETRCGE
jgi:hypothetical protein